MGSLVQLGDVPAWIGAATGAASLYIGLRNRQQAQALDWAGTLEKLAGLTPEELRRTVEDNPVIAQMVDLAWEEAARTASEAKRRLLAKVVAAAIAGDADAEVDPHPFLLRTAIELDPAHVTLLVAVGQAGGNIEYMAARWPGPADLRGATLATLQRAGLVQQPYQLMGGTARSWFLTSYGQRFFTFLEEAGETGQTQAVPAQDGTRPFPSHPSAIHASRRA